MQGWGSRACSFFSYSRCGANRWLGRQSVCCCTCGWGGRERMSGEQGAVALEGTQVGSIVPACVGSGMKPLIRIVLSSPLYYLARLQAIAAAY